MVDEGQGFLLRCRREQANEYKRQHAGRHAEHASRDRRDMKPLRGTGAAQSRMRMRHVIHAHGKAGNDAGDSALPVAAFPEHAQRQYRKQR